MSAKRAGLVVGFLAAICLGAAALLAQQPLTNADVIKMVKAGLGEKVVLAAIEGAEARSFDTSTDGLLALKTSGVTDAVIAAMVTSVGKGRGAAATANSSADGTAARRTPGIYLALGREEVPLEPTIIAGVRTSGGVSSFFTAGIAKVSAIAEVHGSRASQRTKDQQPTFYFYFDDKSTSATGPSPWSGWMMSASSPNEFVLVQMYAKSDHRELVLAKGNTFGMSSGVEEKNVVPIKIERVSPGAYRVVPGENLGHGEFCFFYAAGTLKETAATTMKLFDFGVD